MNIKYVVIHKGDAHRDEFLALGIALHSGLIDKDTPTYREDLTPVDLKDPRILVLDVGREHSPIHNNFDHHQLDRGTLECAMSLIAKKMLVPE